MDALSMRAENLSTCLHRKQEVPISHHSFHIVEYIKSTPPVYNNETECEESELILREFIGDHVIPIIDEVPPHGTDDFACFQNELPGLFFFLGSANLEKGIEAANHTPTFDAEEDCLTFGVKTMSSFLLEILERREI